MTQEDHGPESIHPGRRNATQRRNRHEESSQCLLEPLLRLEHESWHRRSAHPFRAGLATTSWQLAQAHSLFGKYHSLQHDDILVVMALTNKPRANLGWALAALTLQRECNHHPDAQSSIGCVKVTDISFSAHAPQERRELLAALVDSAHQAVQEKWQLSTIELSEAVMKQHATWLKHRKLMVPEQN